MLNFSNWPKKMHSPCNIQHHNTVFCQKMRRPRSLEMTVNVVVVYGNFSLWTCSNMSSKGFTSFNIYNILLAVHHSVFCSVQLSIVMFHPLFIASKVDKRGGQRLYCFYMIILLHSECLSGHKKERNRIASSKRCVADVMAYCPTLRDLYF